MTEKLAKMAFLAGAFIFFLLAAASCRGPGYTARVVDAETGEPLEGAVYLAAWWKEVGGRKAWFEGTSTVMDRFAEGHTDGNGEIHVPGFWRKVPFFGRERTLTVYKPGYVIWNSQYVFPDYLKRTDFALKTNEVKLKRWSRHYAYGKHSSFLTKVTKGNVTQEPYVSGDQLLFNTYKEFESSLYIEERLKGEK